MSQLPSVSERLVELGVRLEAYTPPPGPLLPVVVHGGLAWVSGQPPSRDGKIQHTGPVGSAVSIDEAYDAARLCVLNCLGQLEAVLGSLDRVERIVKVVGFVSCAAGFSQQSKVVNGASELLVALFGEERGRHARSAVGVASLPADMSVEVELVAAVRDDGR